MEEDNRSLWEKIKNDDIRYYNPAMGVLKFYVITIVVALLANKFA